ncbi:MAG: thiol reductant ABC exporter subunit CydC [Lacisediminihabitans sp.]
METSTREILRLAQPRLRLFWPGVIFGLLSAACAVALLAASAYLITKAAEQPPLLYLSMIIVGVRAFALGRAAFRYLERLTSHDAALRTLATLRVGIYRRLVPLAPDGMAQSRKGELLSGLVSDVDELQNLPLRVVQPLVVSTLVAALAVIGVWLVSPSAGLALAACLLLAFLLGTAAHSAISSRGERALAPLRARLVDLTVDFVSNLDVLVAFGDADRRLAAIERADADLRLVGLKRAAGVGVATALVSLLSGAAIVAALLLSGPALSSGALDGPVFAVVVLVPMAVFEVFAALPLAAGAWRQVAASARRVAETVPAGIPPELPVESGAIVPSAAGGLHGGLHGGPPGGQHRRGVGIELRNLGARWPGTEASALSGVSLSVQPGDRLLIEGPSGSGKTSLAHVLVRFLDHTGDYLIDGREAATLEPAEVRTLVGLSEQSPFIFDNTVRQNLLFARDTATDDELMAALDRVGLGGWTRERGGLDARVGERGALVSGGQAQRIGLARALLADFPVLVLDEPTANVDPGLADELMRDVLAAVGDTRSVILISHTPVPDELVTARLRLEAGRVAI